MSESESVSVSESESESATSQKSLFNCGDLDPDSGVRDNDEVRGIDEIFPSH